MGQEIFQVDAFTDKPFSGNPAAVCVLPGPADERWMQNVAREMNLSETAFLYQQKDDFVSRFFAPTVGINEDPVTGSAHCCLGPFWANRLGKNKLVAYQASARGGTVRIRVDGNRVFIGGQAVTVLRGELR